MCSLNQENRGILRTVRENEGVIKYWMEESLGSKGVLNELKDSVFPDVWGDIWDGRIEKGKESWFRR